MHAKTGARNESLEPRRPERTQRVEEIRRQIREQRYESDRKLEIAISRLLDDIRS